MFNLKQFLINIIAIILCFLILHVILFSSIYASYILTGYVVNLDIAILLILTAEIHIALTIIFKRRK